MPARTPSSRGCAWFHRLQLALALAKTPAAVPFAVFGVFLALSVFGEGPAAVGVLFLLAAVTGPAVHGLLAMATCHGATRTVRAATWPVAVAALALVAALDAAVLAVFHPLLIRVPYYAAIAAALLAAHAAVFALLTRPGVQAALGRRGTGGDARRERGSA